VDVPGEVLRKKCSCEVKLRAVIVLILCRRQQDFSAPALSVRLKGDGCAIPKNAFKNSTNRQPIVFSPTTIRVRGREAKHAST